jgi:hypothetical protein
MAGYPYVGRVTDPAAMQALKAAFDQIADLRRQITALQAAALQNTTDLNANNHRVTNLATPQAGGDAVTLTFLTQYVEAQLEAFG